jgi:hypothetical protein
MVTEFANLSNSDEARVEAAKRIGMLLHAHAGKLWVDEDWTDGRDRRHRADPFRHKHLCVEKPGDLIRLANLNLLGRVSSTSDVGTPLRHARLF